MSHVLGIAAFAFNTAWVIIMPLDFITILHFPLARRMAKGWCRRRMIRKFGPAGIVFARAFWWLGVGLPSVIFLITGSHGLSQFLINIYWLVIGLVNAVDFITSWDDPPWKRALKWASERVQKLLDNMGERSRAPGIPQPI